MLLFTASIAIPESAVGMVTTLPSGRPKNRGSNSGRGKKYCAVHVTTSRGHSGLSHFGTQLRDTVTNLNNMIGQFHVVTLRLTVV
jgi:hypothetical protein